MEAISSAPTMPLPVSEAQAFDRCERCEAPVAADQRYCVECGAHRRHVHDPAARYMLARRSRVGTTATRGPARATSRPPSLVLALLMAVVPLAVGLGVLVGRSSNNGDAKLIAALRAQRPEIITTGGGSAATQASTSPTAAASSVLASTFPLQRGWTVELKTLPSSGATEASVAAAKAAARAKGASDVGLISLRDFRVTPAPASGGYVVYAGAYHSQAAAQRALNKLSRRFPGAKVIHVQSVTAGTSATGGGRVLSSSVYGSAHQIAGSKPTSSQLAAGKQVVQHIQQTQGKSYVNAQRGLPDQISIP